MNKYETAWDTLYRIFGERLEQENLELMQSVLQAVEMEMQEVDNMILIAQARTEARMRNEAEAHERMLADHER